MEFKTLVYQFIYLATGCLSTMITQYLFYAGAAEKKTYLTVLAQYFAMTLSVFIPVNDNSKKAKVSFFAKPAHIKKNIIIISLIDIFANVISTFGMFLIGSGIYQVIHSAIVVFTAILSRIFLNKKFTIQQWFSLIVITSGLSLSAIGGRSNATGVMGTIGIAITIFGTICYAIIYVLNERILKHEDGPTATQHSVWVGTCSASITFVYILFFVFPKLDMRKSMMNAPLYPNSPMINIILAYVSLVLSHFLHSYTYFVLLGKSGAVTTGVINSIRAVSVFFLSSALYCRDDVSQCFTRPKVASCVVVVVGILLYSVFSSKAQQQQQHKNKNKE
jgi:drug/metabolite transporter (DMT)-like permease